MVPKGSQREPKGRQREPKGRQREPKGSQHGAKGRPKCSRSVTHGLTCCRLSDSARAHCSQLWPTRTRQAYTASQERKHLLSIISAFRTKSTDTRPHTPDGSLGLGGPATTRVSGPSSCPFWSNHEFLLLASVNTYGLTCCHPGDHSHTFTPCLGGARGGFNAFPPLCIVGNTCCKSIWRQ